jgi:rhamnulokinase
MAATTVLAIDLGAESGRVVAVRYDGARLTLDELARFPNEPVRVRGTLHWDVLRLWRDVSDGIAASKPLRPKSLGIDTWGVDFGLLDAQGSLLGNPVHYRDDRTLGMLALAERRVGRPAIFETTGIQFMPINTIYQLLSLAERQSPQLAAAETFLTMPDLLNYWLTGERVCEFSNATTTQMLDARTGDWARPLLTSLGIPTPMLPPIVQPGTQLGRYADIAVIAPACHDTGSAVAAVPTQTPNYAYISSGTWSLVGLEVTEPVITAAALAANVTNEGGVWGTYRLLKNVMGLWSVQQCRAAWQARGQRYSYADLVALAEHAPPLRSLIAPNDVRFLPPGDHPRLVREWCATNGEPLPDGEGAIMRCVLESLALEYRAVLDDLTALSGRTVEVIHVVGGGIQNTLLCQMTADATGIPVLAGPVEATVIGNALVQLIALGELNNLAEARALVRAMHTPTLYEPRDHEHWNAAYQRFRALTRDS